MPTPVNSAEQVLIAYAENRISHINRGMCPDVINGFDERDPDCPVCQALAAAATPVSAADHLPEAGKMVLVPVDPTMEQRMAALHMSRETPEAYRPLRVAYELHDSARVYRAMISAAPKPGAGWMPIAEAPKDGTAVLLLGARNKHADGYWLQSAYDGNGAWIWPFVYANPTHWQPLPQPPKEKP